MSRSLIYIGDDGTQGSYVLRVAVRKYLAIRFGRFKEGKVINVPPGDYLYIGSAMGAKGASCLARRLTRHASRCGENKPHKIRTAMLREFPQVGLVNGRLQASARKTLRWNVDHLLQSASANLVSVYVVRSPVALEADIGDLLESDSATSVFEKGLGANDRPGHTYLLRVEADETWWDGLAPRLESLGAAAKEVVV